MSINIDEEKKMTINPSTARLIMAFKTEIEEQKISAKIGIKGAAGEAQHLTEALTEALKDFTRTMGLEQCGVCYCYSDDCHSSDYYDHECPRCLPSGRYG